MRILHLVTMILGVPMRHHWLLELQHKELYWVLLQLLILPMGLPLVVGILFYSAKSATYHLRFEVIELLRTGFVLPL